MRNSRLKSGALRSDRPRAALVPSLPRQFCRFLWSDCSFRRPSPFQHVAAERAIRLGSELLAADFLCRESLAMSNAPSPALTSQLRASIAALLDEGKKLEAIELLRRHVDVSLLDAKQFIEQWPHGQLHAGTWRMDAVARSAAVQRSWRLVPLACAGIFLALGVLFACIAWSLHESQASLAESGRPLQGTVVGLQSQRGSVAPIVAYEVDGARYEYRDSVFTSLKSYRTGDVLPLLVDTERPESPLIDDQVHRFSGVLIFVVLASGMLAAGSLCGIVGVWR